MLGSSHSHLCCLWLDWDLYYSLPTKSILALDKVDWVRAEQLSGRDGTIYGLIRSRGATDPQEGFVFIWDFPVVAVHSQIKLLLMGFNGCLWFYPELHGNSLGFMSENYITQTCLIGLWYQSLQLAPCCRRGWVLLHTCTRYIYDRHKRHVVHRCLCAMHLLNRRRCAYSF